MTTHHMRQSRCRSQIDAGCRRAHGYSYLVLEWLPWTTSGSCRKCAEATHPALVASVGAQAIAQATQHLALIPSHRDIPETQNLL